MKRSSETSRQPSESSDSSSADEYDTLDLKSCEVCRTKSNDSRLLICDGCSDQYHTFCLTPKLNNVPKGKWFCVKCVERYKIARASNAAFGKNAVSSAVTSPKQLTGPRASARVLSPVSVNMEVTNSKKRVRPSKAVAAVKKKLQPRKKRLKVGTYIASLDLKSCEVCHTKNNENKLLICDGCDDQYHMYCLVPALSGIPKGDWFCNDCDQISTKAVSKTVSNSQSSSSNSKKAVSTIKSSSVNDDSDATDPTYSPRRIIRAGKRSKVAEGLNIPKVDDREKAFQSIMFTSSNRSNTTQQTNVVAIDNSREKALLSVLFPTSRINITPQQTHGSSLDISRERALQSVLPPRTSATIVDNSREKALQSVMLPTSRINITPQQTHASSIDISRERALQSVLRPYTTAAIVDNSREKALQSVMLPTSHSNASPQQQKVIQALSSPIDISREKALQSVMASSSDTQSKTKERALQSVLFPSSRISNTPQEQSHISSIDSSREKGLQSVSMPARNDSIRALPSSKPMTNQANEASRIVGMYRSTPAAGSKNTMVQLEAVNSQNDPVMHPRNDSVARSSSKKTPTRVSFSSNTQVNTVADLLADTPSKQHIAHGYQGTSPVAMELVTSQNDPLTIVSKVRMSATKNSVAGIAGSTSVSSHARSSTGRFTDTTNTGITSATKNAVPSAANTSASKNRISSVTSTGTASALKSTVPSATNSSVSSTSKNGILGVTSTDIATASKNAVSIVTNTSTLSPTKNAAPSATNNTTPNAASTSSPSSTKNAAPSATKTAVPISATTSAPSATKNAVPSATDTSAPSAGSSTLPNSSTNSLPSAFFSSPTKRVWQREDISSIPYSNFSELKSMLTTSSYDSSVSIIGIVASFSRPKKCSGKNKLMASYSLVDATSKSASDVVIVNIFGDKIENFPKITVIGDILRLNRVKLGEYKGTPQLIGGKAFNSAFTCFHRSNIYDGTSTTKTLPVGSRIYQSTVSGVQVEVKQRVVRRGGAEKQTEVCIPLSTEWNVSAADFFDENHETREIDYSFNVGDMVKIKSLHSYGMNLFIRDPIGDPNAIRSLGSLQQRNANCTDVVKECDFTCMVVRTFVKDGHRYIEAWDGTTTDQITAESIKAISRVDTDMPSQDNSVSIYQAVNMSLHNATVYVDATNEESLAALGSKVNETPATVTRRNILKGASVLIKFPMVDSALYAPVLNTGVWIRIRYLRQLDVGTTHGQLLVVGFIDDSTHVNIIYPYYKDVTTVASRYAQRAHFEPVTHVAPVRRVVSSDGSPLTPLQFVLAAPSPSKFCTAVRIVRYTPDAILSFVSKTSSLDPSSSKYSPEVVQAIEQLRFNKDYYFQFTLRVADDTAEYDLIAYNKDAEYLLGGITAEKFVSNLDTRKMIKERLDQMIASNTIIDVCIRTYESEETIGQNSRLVKRLQVYNTNLISRMK